LVHRQSSLACGVEDAGEVHIGYYGYIGCFRNGIHSSGKFTEEGDGGAVGVEEEAKHGNGTGCILVNKMKFKRVRYTVEKVLGRVVEMEGGESVHVVSKMKSVEGIGVVGHHSVSIVEEFHIRDTFVGDTKGTLCGGNGSVREDVDGALGGARGAGCP